MESFDLPSTVLLDELREQGYGGGITILRDLVADIKDRHVTRLVDRFETEPGRQAQVDWASCGHIMHKGRRRRLSLLVVVLGYSRFIWAGFVVSERRPVLMEMLERCFHEIGGVPRELLFDNLKQVVAQPRTSDSPAAIQPLFQDFADHWLFEVVASPPYWPRAKGKVERVIQYIKRCFLEGRSFVDLDDLNAQLRLWLATVANVRIHGTTKERPVDRLAADLAAMAPATATPSFPKSRHRYPSGRPRRENLLQGRLVLGRPRHHHRPPWRGGRGAGERRHAAGGALPRPGGRRPRPDATRKPAAGSSPPRTQAASETNAASLGAPQRQGPTI